MAAQVACDSETAMAQATRVARAFLAGFTHPH
jgi:hypothetical protein